MTELFTAGSFPIHHSQIYSTRRYMLYVAQEV
jgi:hypothetical protein